MTRPLSADLRVALDAAVDEVIYAQGAHVGAVDEICAAAGVSKPTFYRHYGSRDAMLIDYLRRRRTRRCAAILTAVDAAGASPEARVLALVDWVADWIESDEFVGCGFHRAMLQRPLGLDELRELTSLQKSWVLDLIRHELVDDREPVSRHLFLLIEGAMAAAMYESGRPSAQDLRELARATLAA